MSLTPPWGLPFTTWRWTTPLVSFLLLLEQPPAPMASAITTSSDRAPSAQRVLECMSRPPFIGHYPGPRPGSGSDERGRWRAGGQMRRQQGGDRPVSRTRTAKADRSSDGRTAPGVQSHPRYRWPAEVMGESDGGADQGGSGDGDPATVGGDRGQSPGVAGGQHALQRLLQ